MWKYTPNNTNFVLTKKPDIAAIVNREFINEGAASMVKPHHFDINPLTLQAHDQLVQGINRGHIPKMSLTDIDMNPIERLFGIKAGQKLRGWSKEYLPLYIVVTGIGTLIMLTKYRQELPDFIGKC